ncbi:MAG: Lrp/AsnC family transcriptional regulator, partial [Candidatus Bathyarchaeia archaeon]
MTGSSSGLNNKMLQLLLEYLKDSNRSDGEIANNIGVSQPTVSRMKSKLIKDGVIDHFSAIPDFTKMGYEILA